MIRRYDTIKQYSVYIKSAAESDISLIENSNEVKIDGVNVITTLPNSGDALFIKADGSKVWVVGTSLNKTLIPVDWTWVGVVYDRKGNQVKVLDKTAVSTKYADVVQFEVGGFTLDGETHTASINLRVSSDYNTNRTFNITYAANDLSEMVTAINTAIEDERTTTSFTNVLWAYMADANNNLVTTTEDATKIIIQFDNWSDYRQYLCQSPSGCTITHITWGDMPESNIYKKTNGRTTNSMGYMNLARFYTYYSTNGRTPDANVPVGSGTGQTTPVTLLAFNESEYCSEIRQVYGSYINYLKAEYTIMYPSKYGSFAFDAKELTEKYANKTAPTKDGGTKFKFPALNAAYAIGYNSEGLTTGNWFLPGCADGIEFMRDDNIDVVNDTIKKMNGTTLTNSVYRWFAERYYVNSARYFNGTYGSLYSNAVTNSYRVQGVTLLDL